jgi:hypothetical protein
VTGREARKGGPAKDRKLARRADPRFSAVVGAFVGDDSVTLPGSGKGFGSNALRVRGKIFAMMSRRGEFVVKLPKERARELVSSGMGAYFDPGHGRLMKEWVVLLASEPSWAALAREARRYAEEAR